MSGEKREEMKKMKKEICAVFDRIFNPVTSVLVGMTGATLLALTGFCAPEITTMVKTAINVVMGVVAFGGVINIVRGIATIAKGLQDDGGGQDAAAISKGRGQLIAGVIMAAPITVFTLFLQQSPGEYVASFFKQG